MPFQDGNTAVFDPLRETGRLAGVHRSQGRLSPHTYTSEPSQILTICIPGSWLPIRLAAIWPEHSADGLDKSLSTNHGDPSSSRDIQLPISQDFKTKAAERRALDHTKDVLLNAGFVINIKKSEMVPTQDLVYVGG